MPTYKISVSENDRKLTHKRGPKTPDMHAQVRQADHVDEIDDIIRQIRKLKVDIVAVQLCCHEDDACRRQDAD